MQMRLHKAHRNLLALAINQNEQVAQLSQWDRAAGSVSSGKMCILWTLYVYLQPLWRNRPAKLSNSVRKTPN